MLERMARNETSDARKKDTREKIELGGLIVKAGLRFERRAVLFGALILFAIGLWWRVNVGAN